VEKEGESWVDCRRHGPYGAPRGRPGYGMDWASRDLGLNFLDRYTAPQALGSIGAAVLNKAYSFVFCGKERNG
jgi:hypothetical protein